MKICNIRQLLEDSLQEFSIDYNILRKQSIVEYLISSGLSEDKVIILSAKLLYTNPVVYVAEGAFSKFFNPAAKKAEDVIKATPSKVGNKIRTSLQNKFGQGATGVKPVTNVNPILHPIKAVGDIINSKESIIRNSPMISVVDSKNNQAKYYAYPDLDFTRPGHKQVYDELVKEFTSRGDKVYEVPVNSGDRLAAAQAKNIVSVSMPAETLNKKQEVQTALDQLTQIITNSKDLLNKYRFLSPSEFDEIKTAIHQIVGNVETKVQDIKQDEVTNIEKLANTSEVTPPNITTESPKKSTEEPVADNSTDNKQSSNSFTSSFNKQFGLEPRKATDLLPPLSTSPDPDKLQQGIEKINLSKQALQKDFQMLEPNSLIPKSTDKAIDVSTDNTIPKQAQVTFKPIKK